jgi:hypothetical protein
MTFKDRLQQIDLEEQNAALQKLETELSDEATETSPHAYTEEGVTVHCAECGSDTFREAHSAIMCSNCGHGPFCNYCWKAHIREFHPLLVQPYDDAARGIRRRARFLKHRWLRTVVKPAALVLGLAALLTAAYFGYVESGSPAATATATAVDDDVRTDLAVELASLSSPVPRAATASLAVQTAAGAVCTIQVRYRSGPSRAAGLDPQIADESGVARWSWRVGRAVTAGSWPIEVTCAANNETSSLNTEVVVTE